jgi:hypothetical protein
MSFPFPQQTVVSENPIEQTITSLNSNPYFIGSMMLLLNLGGRHLATGLTPEQDKFFQSDWFRRTLLFVVFFIATRNIIAAFFMTIVFVILISYLFNDESTLYIFNPNIAKKKKKEPEKPIPNAAGLTPEENEIHKRLTEKIQRTTKNEEKEIPVANDLSSVTQTYSTIMARF